MKNKLYLVSIFVFSTSLMSCTNSFMSKPAEQKTSAPSQTVAVSELNGSNSSSAVGGYLVKNMDEFDKEKLSHALDKALNKSTEWVNASTGISYIVTPTQKLVLNGNPFCRKYTVTAEKNDTKKEWDGTACVSTTDSSWQAVN